MGVDLDIVDKSGAWFSYEGQRLGQGKENAKKVLQEQPELAAEIEAKIRAKLLTVEDLDEFDDEQPESGKQDVE